VAILRWRLLHPASPVTLAIDGRPFEEIAGERGVEVEHAA
jgi:hypothetical protein